jgi:hypothetical protein
VGTASGLALSPSFGSAASSSILDRLSVSSSAAYSLRKLRNAYTGNAIRVRRSSDNAEADIGFTTSGDLDTVALLAHCGAGNGFVTTWYDQSGNNRNATQTTASNQPRIVNSGVLEAVNGKPAISFDGLTQFINLPTSGAPTQNSSLIGVFQTTNSVFGAAGFINIANGAADPEIRLGVGTGGSTTTYRAYWNGAYVTIDNPAVNFQNRSVFNVSFAASGGVTTNTVLVNGSVALSASRSGTWTGASEFTIGRYIIVNSMRAGIAQELIIIQSVLSTTDRQLIERNQGAYYGITAA